MNDFLLAVLILLMVGGVLYAARRLAEKMDQADDLPPPSESANRSWQRRFEKENKP